MSRHILDLEWPSGKRLTAKPTGEKLVQQVAWINKVNLAAMRTFDGNVPLRSPTNFLADCASSVFRASMFTSFRYFL
jgi:hypothetical protein